MLSTILLALAGNLCFSIASLAFTEYARRVTPLWMNATKALVALIALTLTVPLIGLTVWNWHLGLVLAASGLILTKRCFMEWPELHPVQANSFRAVGAGVGFLLMNQFYRPVELRKHFARLTGREAAYVVTASLLGTYVSLLFFFKAMSLGHLSVVSSVAGTGPLFAEAILSVRTRTRPTLLWFLALGFMSVGFALFGLGA